MTDSASHPTYGADNERKRELDAQWTAGLQAERQRRHFEFARWLIAHGRLSDQIGGDVAVEAERKEDL